MNDVNRITREQIVEAENKLLEAIKISDVSTLDKMLHDDLLFITPDGQTVTKRMDLDSHRAGTMVVEEITSTIEIINLIENTAVSTVIYQTKGKMLGKPIAGKFKYIRVWRLFDETWKVIGGSCTQI
jgi:ketosteroid isomerase-like protein